MGNKKRKRSNKNCITNQFKLIDANLSLALLTLKILTTNVNCDLKNLREKLAIAPSAVKTPECRSALAKIAKARNEDVLHILNEAGAIIVPKEVCMVIIPKASPECNESLQHLAIEEAAKKHGPAAAAVTLLTFAAGSQRNKLNDELRSADTPEYVKQLLNLGAEPNYYGAYNSTAVHEAAYCRRPTCLALLLERGGYIHAKTSEGRTPLHAAVISGDEQSVVILLKAGAGVNVKDYCCMTPLHFAAGSPRSSNCVPLLLEAGAHMHSSDCFEMTPLHHAAVSGSEQTVTHLLNANAVVDIRDRWGRIPADLVRSKCEIPQRTLARASLCKLLQVKGKEDISNSDLEEDPFSTSDDVPLRNFSQGFISGLEILRSVAVGGRKPSAKQVESALQRDKRLVHTYSSCKALQAAAENGRAEILTAFMKFGCNVNARESDSWEDENFNVKQGDKWLTCDRNNWPLIHLASAGGCLSAVEVLISGGASLDRTWVMDCADPFGPLEAAAQEGELVVAKLLMLGGCVYDKEQLCGALRLALSPEEWQTDGSDWIERRQLKLARLFLDAGADPNAGDVSGHTAVIGAASAGWLKALSFVVHRGGNVLCQTRTGKAPLHAAARAAHEECVSFLIDAGADVFATDNQGRTPLHYAAEGRIDGKWSYTPWVRPGVVKTIEALIQANAGVNAADNFGMTPLHLAASSPSGMVVVETLLARQAVVDIVDGRDKTPIYYAAKNNLSQIVEILLNAGAVEPVFSIFERPFKENVQCTSNESLESDTEGSEDDKSFDSMGEDFLEKYTDFEFENFTEDEESDDEDETSDEEDSLDGESDEFGDEDSLEVNTEHNVATENFDCVISERKSTKRKASDIETEDKLVKKKRLQVGAENLKQRNSKETALELKKRLAGITWVSQQVGELHGHGEESGVMKSVGGDSVELKQPKTGVEVNESIGDFRRKEKTSMEVCTQEEPCEKVSYDSFPKESLIENVFENRMKHSVWERLGIQNKNVQKEEETLASRPQWDKKGQVVLISDHGDNGHCSLNQFGIKPLSDVSDDNVVAEQTRTRRVMFIKEKSGEFKCSEQSELVVRLNTQELDSKNICVERTIWGSVENYPSESENSSRSNDAFYNWSNGDLQNKNIQMWSDGSSESRYSTAMQEGSVDDTNHHCRPVDESRLCGLPHWEDRQSNRSELVEWEKHATRRKDYGERILVRLQKTSSSKGKDFDSVRKQWMIQNYNKDCSYEQFKQITKTVQFNSEGCCDREMSRCSYRNIGSRDEDLRRQSRDYVFDKKFHNKDKEFDEGSKFVGHYALNMNSKNQRDKDCESHSSGHNYVDRCDRKYTGFERGKSYNEHSTFNRHDHFNRLKRDVGDGYDCESRPSRQSSLNRYSCFDRSMHKKDDRDDCASHYSTERIVERYDHVSRSNKNSIEHQSHCNAQNRFNWQDNTNRQGISKSGNIREMEDEIDCEHHHRRQNSSRRHDYLNRYMREKEYRVNYDSDHSTNSSLNRCDNFNWSNRGREDRLFERVDHCRSSKGHDNLERSFGRRYEADDSKNVRNKQSSMSSNEDCRKLYIETNDYQITHGSSENCSVGNRNYSSRSYDESNDDMFRHISSYGSERSFTGGSNSSDNWNPYNDRREGHKQSISESKELRIKDMLERQEKSRENRREYLERESHCGRPSFSEKSNFDVSGKGRREQAAQSTRQNFRGREDNWRMQEGGKHENTCRDGNEGGSSFETFSYHKKCNSQCCMTPEERLTRKWYSKHNEWNQKDVIETDDFLR